MRWLVVLLVLGMVAAGCSGDDDDTASDATTTTVIEGAFAFADDDLCEWVSEDEVAEFVAAEFEWDGTAVLEGADVPGDPDSCQWRLTSAAGDVLDVGAGNAGMWEDFNRDPYDLGAMEVVDFDEAAGFVEIVSTVSGHPSLSDGVVVHNGGYGSYAFWVPPSGEYLSLRVPLEDGVEPVLVEGDSEARFFGVADRFVQELGWLG